MKLYNYISLFFLVLLILSGCEMKNGPVELISLVASDSVARSGDIVILSCEAQDVDGDKLAYNWSASSGEIAPDGDTARWTAPNKSGYFHVTCKVDDGIGASDAASISIRVVGGVIQGIVTNAVNGTPIEGAIVTINETNTITDSSGTYNIYLAIQSGVYQVSSTMDSFCPYNGTFEIPEDFTSNLYTFSYSLSPIPEPGEIRMVLNWGSEPSDLDSHLKTPSIEGQSYHISYSNRGSTDSPPYAILDIDDTNGYGPETVTIRQSFSGTYVYYIYQYSLSGSFRDSKGTVQIYNSPDCSGETITVPDDGSGRYWYVCNIDGENGEITIINQVQNSEPSL
tara:strand:+ start:342 stop:1358 length:1017 start_codon:yes stop_codon:yes gene_type:complete